MRHDQLRHIHRRTPQHRRSARSSVRRRLAAVAFAFAAGTATGLATTGTAAASVASGRGQIAFTTTQCQTSITHNHAFNAQAHVVQEFAGQYVAARFWIYDASRSWKATNWSVQSSPGWQYDGSVAFDGTFNGLTGDWAYLYVQYAWYDANGWRVGAELLTDYTDIFGQHTGYCIL